MDQLREEITDLFNKYNIPMTDVKFYTKEKWVERGEMYGNESQMTMTFEGPFYHIYNNPEVKQDFQMLEDFNTILRKWNLYAEGGFAWSLHFYPINRQLVEHK